MNFTRMSFTPQPEYDVMNNSRTNGGVFVTFDLNQILSLETRLMWVQKSVKMEMAAAGIVGAGTAKAARRCSGHEGGEPAPSWGAGVRSGSLPE